MTGKLDVVDSGSQWTFSIGKLRIDLYFACAIMVPEFFFGRELVYNWAFV
jgi:hypothetical protein